MKIFYLSNHDLAKDSGVVTKIRAQISEWEKSGIEVIIFSIAGLKVYDSKFQLLEQSRWVGLLRWAWFMRFIVMHFFSFLSILKYSPDIVYSRHFFYSPFLTLIQIRHKFVYEINGDDVSELKLEKRKVLSFYNLLTRALNFLPCSGFVFVSHELKERFNFQAPSVVIPNGYTLPEEMTKSPFMFKQNAAVHVAFTGTEGQSWHGVDKIVPFFNGSWNAHLHVIGLTGTNSEYVTYYGRVSAQENLSIVSACNVCLSTLALHRKNMNEACPLKSREYISLGKRFIYAYNDPDVDPIANIFPDSFLKLPNTENNIEMNWSKIHKFLVAGEREETSQAMSLARDVISYQSKEKLRLNFLRSLNV